MPRDQRVDPCMTSIGFIVCGKTRRLSQVGRLVFEKQNKEVKPVVRKHVD